MSFSLEVKKELLNKMDTARHCQIAEFAALMSFTAHVIETEEGLIGIESLTENTLVVEKFELLLKTLFDVKESDYTKSHELNSSKLITIRIFKQQLVANILQTIKWCDDTFLSIEEQFLDSRIIQKDCCMDRSTAPLRPASASCATTQRRESIESFTSRPPRA